MTTAPTIPPAAHRDETPAKVRHEAGRSARAVLKSLGICLSLKTAAAFEQACDVAASEGFEHGEQRGFTGGWRWGFLCGLTAGVALVSTALLIGYLRTPLV